MEKRIKKTIKAVNEKQAKSAGDIKRIIDANLNRCREGLRVVEDGLRFVLDDAALYKKVRRIRHDTDKILRNGYGLVICECDVFMRFWQKNAGDYEIGRASCRERV